MLPVPTPEGRCGEDCPALQRVGDREDNAAWCVLVNADLVWDGYGWRGACSEAKAMPRKVYRDRIDMQESNDYGTVYVFACPDCGNEIRVCDIQSSAPVCCGRRWSVTVMAMGASILENHKEKWAPEAPQCTSLRCGSVPGENPHCDSCSHALYEGHGEDVAGKVWRWTFNPQFGPLFLRKDGEPLARQPIRENHPAWGPFQRWLDKRQSRIRKKAEGGAK